MTAEAVESIAERLKRESNELQQAFIDQAAAEDVWEQLYDLVAESLAEEAAGKGRAHPAEHAVKTTARRQHRAEWQLYRRAKRKVAELEIVCQNTRSELSGYQSALKGASEPQPGQMQRRRAA